MAKRQRVIDSEYLETKAWAKKYLPAWITTSFPLHRKELSTGNKRLQVYRDKGFYVSPRLQADPKAILDMQTEIREFKLQWPEQYAQTINSLYDLQIVPLEKNIAKSKKLKSIV